MSKWKFLPSPALVVLWAVNGERDPNPWNWERLVWHIVQVLIYVFLGLAIFAVAYLVIDKLTPFSFGRELLENKNTAMAIVLGSIFIGIALILAAAIL
jgi:uncharacterized membrane protein YjfL (UPF0719 family)